MSLDENKAGAAAVDPSDFNTIVDAVVTLQAGGGGGSQPGTLVVKEYIVTAADVAAGWNIGDSAGIAEIWQPAEGDIIYGVPDVSITAGDEFAGPGTYVGGISSQGLSQGLGPDYDLSATDSGFDGYSYSTSSDGSSPNGPPPLGGIRAGASADPLVLRVRDTDSGGDTPPNAGSATIRFVVSVAA